MARGNSFNNSRVALGTRLEGNRPTRATPEQLDAQQGVPFPTERCATTQLYLRLRNLDIRPPRHYRVEFLRCLPIWNTLRGYLNCLRLTRLITNQWEGHNSLCLEMCCSFRLETNEDGELCMFSTFNGVLWEVSRAVMGSVFGFHVGDNLSEFVPADFDVATAWYSLSGVANYKTSGVLSAFIRDDALLILHRFLSCMITAKKEHSKVNAVEIYLLTCARDNVRVCLAPFIWAQLANVQNKRGAHPTLSYIATGLACHFRVDTTHCEGRTPSQEIAPSDFIKAHLMRSPTKFFPVQERPSVIAHFANRRRRGIVHEEEQEEEEEEEEQAYEAGGDDEEGDSEEEEEEQQEE